MDQPISTERQLGHLLQGARKNARLTQAQLAQQAGISQERLSVLELNPGRITVERLLRLLGALGLELTIQKKPVAVLTVQQQTTTYPPNDPAAASEW
jgi:HTH-type transcriptional regulator/antitoxin HipB